LQTKKHLDRIGVTYQEVNIREDEAALTKIVNMGFQAAPVVMVNDKAWSGYQPDKLNELAA
jgi:glutaredoxin-like protein NrdH